MSQEIGATCSAPVGVRVEDRAAEHQADRNLAIRQAVEVLGRRDAEIEGAGHLQVDGRDAGELRDHGAGVGPQQIAQSLAPALRLAEKIAQPLLVRGGVSAARHFDLNLAAQHDGVDRLSRIGIRHAQLERQRGRRREGNNLGFLDRDS